ncbi:hypothetical protein [Mycolicibacterium rhodesiae]|uniref:hypothetical protein n=1 Tax=Mycolicibacterium rhodesiae TaxID=36814 RepID=UPI0020A67F9E|nr:hypothetical protein [Mycolicibacterium rhodesiae]
MCIYCPETDECYYVRPHAYGASVTLRIRPAGTASKPLKALRTSAQRTSVVTTEGPQREESDER